MNKSISISNLCSSYRKQQVLNGIDLPELKSMVGLIGPNGSGKSTLVKAIAGIQPHTGMITFHGEKTDASQLSAPRRLGYLPQGIPNGVSLTVLESVMVAARRTGGLRLNAGDIDDAVRVLSDVGIAHLADRYLGELSGGQRQLVGLAQLLVREPDIMLLDEPTSALDLQHQLDVLRIVKRNVQKQSGTALVILHDLNLAAAFCDEIVLLENGRVAGRGTPEEVLNPQLLAKVYHVETTIIRQNDHVVVCPVIA
ncbi:iron complex transport system ATP-binding protein [Arcanobacterium pluranimalium]|uniref:ABC transporter ATP-binding protein n=1 Tax=Arcanobacterium pluranimalium TaxID=108028 RepID=UPI0019580B7A|nr:ABC transporter ATP-binding protein [Arcanobacterium pluranimalium]MBM7824307.1 iron complex transport system ATP-binding protein [Arcanobacterium pluranimalium]